MVSIRGAVSDFATIHSSKHQGVHSFHPEVEVRCVRSEPPPPPPRVRWREHAASSAASDTGAIPKERSAEDLFDGFLRSTDQATIDQAPTSRVGQLSTQLAKANRPEIMFSDG